MYEYYTFYSDEIIVLVQRGALWNASMPPQDIRASAETRALGV